MKKRKQKTQNAKLRKLKKGDEVKIVTGKDKGKSGKIEKVFPQQNKVMVVGVNEYKRHMKARSQQQKSEIVTITKPVPIANVQLVCPKCRLPTRLGFIQEGGKKKRICRKCEAVL